MSAPRRLALIGFMGAGKSTVGQLLATRWGLPFVDLDRVVGDPAALLRREGEVALRAREWSCLQPLLEGDGVLALGGGTPTIPGVMEALAAWGPTVFLDAPLEELARRVQGSDRPLWDPARLEARLPVYRQARYIVDGSGPPEVVADRVEAALC